MGTANYYIVVGNTVEYQSHNNITWMNSTQYAKLREGIWDSVVFLTTLGSNFDKQAFLYEGKLVRFLNQYDTGDKTNSEAFRLLSIWAKVFEKVVDSVSRYLLSADSEDLYSLSSKLSEEKVLICIKFCNELLSSGYAEKHKYMLKYTKFCLILFLLLQDIDLSETLFEDYKKLIKELNFQ